MARSRESNNSPVAEQVEDTVDRLDVKLAHHLEVVGDVGCFLPGSYGVLDCFKFFRLHINRNVRTLEVVDGSGMIQVSMTENHCFELLQGSDPVSLTEF